jgi:geranylgeranyl diphosphate synthase type II
MQYTSAQILEKVNSCIASLPYTRQPKGLYDPIRYVLSMGGKRLRPTLMLMAYNLYKDDVDSIISQAVGLETYHNYTLLHDDLMDKADMRRGHVTVHRKWDPNRAILSGDTMLVLAYRMMARCDSRKLPQVLDLFTETALEIGEGQQYDMEFETRDDVTEAEYIEMIRLKTSVLLACATRIGAILADVPESDAKALYDFGEQMGLAFQLQDDFLDVYGDERTFGKKIGGDIMCGKKTYLLINAFLRADREQRASLEHWLATEPADGEEKIAAITRIYNEVGIPALCRQKIDLYFDRAEECLAKVQVPEENKRELRLFAQSLVNRQS